MEVPIYIKGASKQLVAEWKRNGNHCLTCGTKMDTNLPRYECVACYKARRKKQRQAHITKIQANEQRKRAERLGLTDHFNETEWKLLCLRYGNVCLNCQEKLPLSPDHIIPLTMGGTNMIDNIQPLCWKCNNAKNNRIIDYRLGAPFKDIKGVPDRFCYYILSRFMDTQ